MKNIRCELKNENYIVAFVDILGASKKIKSDPDKSLNVVHGVYEYVLHYLKAFCDDVDLIEAKPIFRVFSDNIIVAVPVEPHGIEAAFYLLLSTQHLCKITFWCQNVLLAAECQ